MPIGGPYGFGQHSSRQLATVHPLLRSVIEDAIYFVDFTVLEGHRGQEDQHRAFASGNSKLDWPKSKHNKSPSEAVDLWPYPHPRKDEDVIRQLCYIAGHVMAIAAAKGVRVRWGGDWNRNDQLEDNSFDDWGHFELD